MFSYFISLTCEIEGAEYSFEDNWESPVQLRAGDFLYINGLEDVLVEAVVWYMEPKPNAFVQLTRQACEGTVQDWDCILDDLGHSNLPIGEECTTP